jgi:nicotinate-nucleotide adenylyltransferase
VELAIANNPFFGASSVELERAGASYSIDTIRYFLSTFRPSYLAFIVGVDAFRELHLWKEYELIPALCNLIVTSRPGENVPSLDCVLPVALKSSFWYDSSIHMYRHVSGHSLLLHQITGLLIASSTIRALIRQGRSIRYLVPSAVETYISHHHLYQIEGSPR